jgi:hypothetical protein
VTSPSSPLLFSSPTFNALAATQLAPLIKTFQEYGPALAEKYGLAITPDFAPFLNTLYPQWWLPEQPQKLELPPPAPTPVEHVRVVKKGGAPRLEKRADQSWKDQIREIQATAREEGISEEIISESRHGLPYPTFRNRARRLKQLAG